MQNLQACVPGAKWLVACRLRARHAHTTRTAGGLRACVLRSRGRAGPALGVSVTAPPTNNFFIFW